MSHQRSAVYFIFLAFYLVHTSVCLKTNKFIITFGRPSNQPYSVITQLCCNGIQHAKSNSNISCCGNQTYNRETQLCCGITVTPLTPFTKCCFNVPYNSQTNNCDYLVTEARLGEDGLKVWTIDRKQKVVTPSLESSHFMCGEQVINLKTHICCNQTLIKIQGDNKRCCGDQAYSPGANFCCHSHPAKLLPPVKNDEDFCCNGKPYKHGRETCIWGNGTTINQLKPTDTLCDGKIIDKRNNICCRHSGNSERVIKKLRNHHTGCCGNASYTHSEEICCEDRLIARDGPLQCCYGSGPYDPSTDTCCRKYNFIGPEKKSRIYKNKLGSCCFLSLYDQTKESCCGISVIPKLPGDRSGCCEYKMDGYEAAMDEFVSVYEPPFEEITGY